MSQVIEQDPAGRGSEMSTFKCEVIYSRMKRRNQKNTANRLIPRALMLMTKRLEKHKTYIATKAAPE
jgi:hypothetical protein